MNTQLIVFYLIYFGALGFSVFVFYYAWKNRKGAGINAFAWSIFFEITWLIGYYFEIVSPTLSTKLFWDNLQWIGALFAPVTLLIFSLEFTGRKFNPQWVSAALSVIPALSVIVIIFNILPDLTHINIAIRDGDLFSELTYEYGTIINIAVNYLYLVSLAMLIVLVLGFFKKSGVSRPQLFIITLGTLVPVAGSIIAQTLGLKYAGQRDISPLTFVVSNVVIAFGIFRYRLFNLIPVARDALFENIEDILIILNKEDQIVDINPSGRDALGGNIVIGNSIEEYLPDLYEQFRDIQNTRVEIALTDNSFYDLRITSLHDHTGQLSGRLINAHNITQQKAISTELAAINTRIDKRANQLQAITSLSESVAQLQSLNELFPTVTKLISELFGFYHVGIFLIDEENVFAVLQATNSEGGYKMLERGHRLKIGTGVVGFSVLSGQPRIALDVGDDAVFFDNPDLPNTRSEAALPLKTRGKTIGVLDVQSTESNAFSTDDLQVLNTLANQVAIAIENIRLLTETRTALAQVQQVYDEFTRTEWSRTIASAEQPGFRYNAGRIEIVDKQIESPEITSVVETGRAIKIQTGDNEKKRSSVVVPVKFRGEVIGIIQVESNEISKEWLDDEVSLVEAVAERAAFAMENARLFQDARRRAAKEQLISQATSKISSALDIENILLTTAEELESVLGGSEVLIRFQSKETE